MSMMQTIHKHRGFIVAIRILVGFELPRVCFPFLLHLDPTADHQMLAIVARERDQANLPNRSRSLMH